MTCIAMGLHHASCIRGTCKLSSMLGPAARPDPTLRLDFIRPMVAVARAAHQRRAPRAGSTTPTHVFSPLQYFPFACILSVEGRKGGR